QVEGDCMGAGRRYIEQVCPGCQVLSGDGKSGQSVEPGVVMWMDGASGSEAVSAVSANCSRVAANGSAIVDVLRFAGGPLSLEQSGTQLALDIVPLLHRAERVAVFEMGGWLATMDEVPNPRTAINDMLIALKQRGWREASDHESADVKMFAQQRVFTNNDNALCVVTLSQEGDTAQLLTIMSSYTRG
ncbi:hypothetical protein N9878_01995, partial [bacterium]|nr:hypothetical protein [bacterium]